MSNKTIIYIHQSKDQDVYKLINNQNGSHQELILHTKPKRIKDDHPHASESSSIIHASVVSCNDRAVDGTDKPIIKERSSRRTNHQAPYVCLRMSFIGMQSPLS